MNHLQLCLDWQHPQWLPLADWSELMPLPDGLTRLHVVGWLTPDTLAPLINGLLEVLDVPHATQVVTHLIVGEGFASLTDLEEAIRAVEELLLDAEQPPVTTLIGAEALSSQPERLGQLVTQAKGAHHFFSLKAIQLSGVDNPSPMALPACVLDLAYEGFQPGEPVVGFLPESWQPLNWLQPETATAQASY